MVIINKSYIYALFFSVLFSPLFASEFKRPATIQQQCDDAFEIVKSMPSDIWANNGSKPYYNLMGIKDEKLIQYVLQENQDEQDIYIVDVGCAGGMWGKHAFNTLKGKVKDADKHIYIFSLTGATECREEIFVGENITLYQFNHFKIENIDEELALRGFDLTNKVNLIISSSTLCHLVDPLGTLIRMYSLLSPLKGLLITDNFYVGSDSNNIWPFYAYFDYFIKSNAISLFSRDYPNNNHLLLMRADSKNLTLPLEYSQRIIPYLKRYDCGSQKVTVFKDLPTHCQDVKYINFLQVNKWTYSFYKESLLAQELYEKLQAHELFL